MAPDIADKLRANGLACAISDPLSHRGWLSFVEACVCVLFRAGWQGRDFLKVSKGRIY